MSSAMISSSPIFQSTVSQLTTASGMPGFLLKKNPMKRGKHHLRPEEEGPAPHDPAHCIILDHSETNAPENVFPCGFRGGFQLGLRVKQGIHRQRQLLGQPKARDRVGSYLLFSMAFTVCRDTPHFLASSSWDSPSSFRRCRMQFSTSSTQLSLIVQQRNKIQNGCHLQLDKKDSPPWAGCGQNSRSHPEWPPRSSPTR